jgi:hypothetical protein
LLGQEIGHDTGCDDNEKEYQYDKRKPDPDDPPIIKKMELGFVRVGGIHQSGRSTTIFGAMKKETRRREGGMDGLSTKVRAAVSCAKN